MATRTLTKQRQTSIMDGGKVTLGTLTTATTSDEVRVVGYLVRTLEVVNGITTTIAFTVQGGFKRTDGTISWYTLGTRAVAGTAFSTTALAPVGGASAIYEIEPTPAADYIRVNVSTPNANGTTFYLHCMV